MLATIPALDTLHTAPVEVRQFIAQALLDFSAAHPGAEGVFPFRPSNDYDDGSGTTGALRSARTVLGLDMTTGNEPERRQWLTNAHDVHPGIRSLHQAVNSGAWTPAAPTPTLTASGDEKNRVRQAEALAVMRRRESMALADRAAADQRIRDLEARLSAAEAPRVETRSVSWGPSHPDWMPFWRQAAADAEAAGNCSEYDRHAREMGGPTRDSLRYDNEGIRNGRRKTVDYTVDVTVEVVMTVTVTCEDGDLDSSLVADALDGYSFGDAEYSAVSDYSVSDEETTDEHGSGAYWNNPESE